MVIHLAQAAHTIIIEEAKVMIITAATHQQITIAAMIHLIIDFRK